MNKDKNDKTLYAFLTVACLGLLAMLPEALYAADFSENIAVLPHPSIAQYLKTFAMLVVVLAILVLAAYLFAKIQRNFNPNGNIMKVCAIMPLSSKEKIMLIKMGVDEYMLLATTASQISLLKAYTGKPDWLEEKSKEASFQNVIQQFILQGKAT